MDGDLRSDSISTGLSTMVMVNSSQPLAELTAIVNSACDRVEDSAERTIVVIRLDGMTLPDRSWPGDVGVADVSRWERAVRRLERLAAINIAVATGTCGGPALDLLLAADFRIASPDLVVLLPINDGHFWPGMAVYRLVQNLGLARARQIVLWGADLPAARAREVGLVDQVADDVSEAVHTASVLMGRISDAELAVRRQLLFDAAATSFEEALGVHLAACDRELRRLRAGRTTESDIA